MSKGVYVGVSDGTNGVAKKVRKMYLGVKNSSTKLTLLDYIETTGTQRINTDIIPDKNTKVEICVTPADITQKWLFGSRSTQTTDTYALYISYSDTGQLWYQYNSDKSSLIDTAINMSNNKTTFVTDKNNLYVNGTKVQTLGDFDFEGKYPMGLFTIFTGTSVDTRMFIGKFHYCKIWDNEVLVRDYVPVLDENGVACLYDKVSMQKFYNKGTGEFIGGTTTGEIISSTKARKVKKGYIGIEGIARLFFISYYPTYITELSRELSQGYSAFGALKDYIICAGGRDSDGATTASVEAFNKKGVHHVLTSLTQKRERHACGSIGGYTLVIGGATATSASNNRMTNTIETYNNDLVKGSASSINKAVFDFNIGANKLHLIQAGGCAYSSDSNQAQSYDTNLVKTTLTNLSQNKQYLSGGNVGENILFVGGTSSNNYVDVYNNNNVHSTIARPSAYASDTRNIGCASTGSYLFCFGGQRGTSETEYNTLVIFDSNLTYTVLTLPISASHWNAFNISNEYVVGQRAASAYVYNNNLVLETEILTNNSGGSAMGRASASNDEFALTGKSTSTGTGTSLFNF